MPELVICGVCGEELENVGPWGNYVHPSSSTVVVRGEAPEDFANHVAEPTWPGDDDD